MLEASTQILSFDIGLRHFAYCLMLVDADGRQTVRELVLVDLGCKKRHVQRVIDSCVDLLDDILYNKLDTSMNTLVLIENQMTAVMRCVQTIVNTYFRLHARHMSLPVTVQCVSAKYKLNLIRQFPAFTASLQQQPKPSKHKRNKQMAVAFASWLLLAKEDTATHTKLMSVSKKDDLADAYLTAVYFAMEVKAPATFPQGAESPCEPASPPEAENPTEIT